MSTPPQIKQVVPDLPNILAQMLTAMMLEAIPEGVREAGECWPVVHVVVEFDAEDGAPAMPPIRVTLEISADLQVLGAAGDLHTASPPGSAEPPDMPLN